MNSFDAIYIRHLLDRRGQAIKSWHGMSEVYGVAGMEEYIKMKQKGYIRAFFEGIWREVVKYL